jgi:hypothetical protein
MDFLFYFFPDATATMHVLVLNALKIVLKQVSSHEIEGSLLCVEQYKTVILYGWDPLQI